MIAPDNGKKELLCAASDQACLDAPILLMRLLFIPVHRDDVTWPIMIVMMILWTTTITVFVYWLRELMMNEQACGWLVVSNLLWLVHSSLTISFVVFSMLTNSRVFDIMTYAVEKDNNDARLRIAGRSQKCMRNKMFFCSLLATILIVAEVVYNIAIIFLHDQNLFFYYLLPVSKDMWWKVVMFIPWYFYSFGYFLTILFACVPSYVLTERIMELVSFVESLNGKGIACCTKLNISISCYPSNITTEAVDLNEINDWYDDLYAINSILNETVSGMVTATLGLCAPLTILIIMVIMCVTILLCSGISSMILKSSVSYV